MDIKPKFDPEEFDEVNPASGPVENKVQPEVVQAPAKVEPVQEVEKKERWKHRQFDLDEGRDPWTKQTKESSKMYQMFLIYMNLGDKRSQVRVVRTVYGEELTADELRRKAAVLSMHAWKWRWSERIKAFEETVEAEKLSHVAKLTHDYPGKLLEWLDTSLNTIRAIQQEDDPQARHELVRRESEGLAVAMGRRGPRILLDGHKQLFGQKTTVDVNQRSVKLNFKFKNNQ